MAGMNLESLKEKLNSIYGSNIPITIQRRDYTQISDEMMQVHLYNMSMILKNHSLYDLYKARAEAIGLDLESIMVASLNLGVNFPDLLGCVEHFVNHTYEGGRVPPNGLYGYTSCSFAFDDGSFEDREETISSLKKRIKYCKNPMEKKKLEKELNALYKSKKRRK